MAHEHVISMPLVDWRGEGRCRLHATNTLTHASFHWHLSPSGLAAAHLTGVKFKCSFWHHWSRHRDISVSACLLGHSHYLTYWHSGNHMLAFSNMLTLRSRHMTCDLSRLSSSGATVHQSIRTACFCLWKDPNVIISVINQTTPSHSSYATLCYHSPLCSTTAHYTTFEWTMPGHPAWSDVLLNMTRALDFRSELHHRRV